MFRSRFATENLEVPRYNPILQEPNPAFKFIQLIRLAKQETISPSIIIIKLFPVLSIILVIGLIEFEQLFVSTKQ